MRHRGGTVRPALHATRSGSARRRTPVHARGRPPGSVHLPFVTTDRGRVWDALGDRTRRTIVERLADGPRAVGELADELPVSRPAVSQHLKVLKDAGLVTERAAGTRRIYRLDPVGVRALRDQLDTFWNRALAGYRDEVEHPREESP